MIDCGLPTRFNVQGRVNRPSDLSDSVSIQSFSAIRLAHQRLPPAAPPAKSSSRVLLNRSPHVILLLTRPLDVSLKAQRLFQTSYFVVERGDVPVSLPDLILQRRNAASSTVPLTDPLVFLLMALLQLGQHLLQIGDAALLNLGGLTRFRALATDPRYGTRFVWLPQLRKPVSASRESVLPRQRRLGSSRLITQTTTIHVQMLPGLLKIAACLVKMPLTLLLRESQRLFDAGDAANSSTSERY